MKKILISLLFFTYSTQAFSDNLSDSNKLFNWAEKNYSQYFNPPKGNKGTFELGNYLVRYYKSTHIYIGTFGDDVYLYGEVFNGLSLVGSIGDFVDITEEVDKKDETDITISTYNTIKIVGSNEFIDQTKNALDLLENLAPTALKKIDQHIGIIEQGTQSHMWADEEPPRYEVDDVDSFHSLKWHAGAIAHEATHAELYDEYKVKQGLPVPADVWSSPTAEKFCIQYQMSIMTKINAPQSDMDALNELLDNENCKIDDICN